MSMNKKTKCFSHSVEAQLKDGKKCTVFVYGELNESGLLDGYILRGIKMTRKGHVIKGYEDEYVTWTADKNATHAPVKEFNMGWSICDSRDKFDVNTGIHIAKKRFAYSPIKTQHGNFLTPDMCQSIVDNEAKYIAEHIDKYVNYYKK